MIKITVFNRGPEAAELHVLPHLWFRNTWSCATGTPKPSLRQISPVANASVLMTAHHELHNYFFILRCPTGAVVHLAASHRRQTQVGEYKTAPLI